MDLVKLDESVTFRRREEKPTQRTIYYTGGGFAFTENFNHLKVTYSDCIYNQETKVVTWSRSDITEIQIFSDRLSVRLPNGNDISCTGVSSGDTLSEGQSIATVTIQEDDSLKYTAKENKGQEIKITALSSKTWDITASNKRDTIEYAGRGEASISAGDGNDSISITGSGEVQVFGDSGKNTIIHTGTGDSTLKGGVGDDTIRSTHADDVIFGGGGNNTFVLTGVETKVSDFTYG